MGDILVVIFHLVDCVWGEFGEWTECSATCGTGSQSRTRTIETPAQNGGVACSGAEMETRDCNTETCPSGS